MDTESSSRCRCATPTALYGGITHSWYCDSCGADIAPGAAGAVTVVGWFPTGAEVGRWATLNERAGK